jgi:hypothetical protein
MRPLDFIQVSISWWHPLDSSPDSLVAVSWMMVISVQYAYASPQLLLTRQVRGPCILCRSFMMSHSSMGSSTVFLLGTSYLCLIFDYDLSDKPKISCIKCIIDYGEGLRDLPQPISGGNGSYEEGISC